MTKINYNIVINFIIIVSLIFNLYIYINYIYPADLQPIQQLLFFLCFCIFFVFIIHIVSSFVVLLCLLLYFWNYSILPGNIFFFSLQKYQQINTIQYGEKIMPILFFWETMNWGKIANIRTYSLVYEYFPRSE